MYQDNSTTNFYNLLFSSRNREEQEVKEEITKVIVTTESATSLSPNDVNFPHDARSGQAEAKYIKISSSIEIPETESVKLVIDALKVLWDASLTSMWKGFMPSMERVRRDTSALESTKGFILDWIVDIIGALIGRQECSQKVACRTGRLAQEKVPGSQMLVMMLESFVPPGLVHWFSILKSGAMSAFDACESSFTCNFTEGEGEKM